MVRLVVSSRTELVTVYTLLPGNVLFDPKSIIIGVLLPETSVRINGLRSVDPSEICLLMLRRMIESTVETIVDDFAIRWTQQMVQ